MAHHNIFRDELAIAYPSRGLALWEPGPGGLYDGVEVGDVGFVREGYFQRLFNVLHPRDHSSHRNPSLVPEDHEQLQVDFEHIIKGEIRAGSEQNCNHLCSKSVTLASRGLGTLTSRPEDASRVTFSCDGKQGALLSLPVSTQSEDTSARAKFGNWMVTHIDAWFALTRSLGMGVERMEDIILVTGRHLTKSWVNVAFNQRRRDAGVSFNAYVTRDSEIHLERHDIHGGELKLGPTGKDLREDQCVFIRGFRVARTLGIWPKLRGQAGPAPDTGGHEPERESGTQLELINVPADANYQDPLHVLLQYIAEQAPQCDLVLVHDDDLANIIGDFLDTSPPHDLKRHLWSSSPTIQQLQCELPPGNTSGPGADVAITKVAMLSRHAFEDAHERPPPQGSSTATGLSPRPSSLLTQYTPIPGDDGGIAHSRYEAALSLRHQIDHDLAPEFDPIRDLILFLKDVRKPESLIRFLRFTSVQSGPDLEPVFIGTYTFRDVVVGKAEGISDDAACRVAAVQALRYFRMYGIPE